MSERIFNSSFSILLLVFCPISIAWLGNIGIVGFLLFILSLLLLVITRPSLNLTKEEKFFVFSMIAFPLATLLSMYINPPNSYKYFDNPSRLIVVLFIFFAIRSLKFSVKFFYWGILLGSILIGSIAAYQAFELGISRVSGFISSPNNPITFGNAGMILGVLSIFTFKKMKDSLGVYAIPLIVIAASMGILASLLSGTRGGWISLPFLLVTICYWVFGVKKRFLILAPIMIVLFFILAASLIPSVESRLLASWYNIEAIGQGDWTSGSFGARLEMWYAACLMFIDNPGFGVGLGQYYVVKKELIAGGILSQTISSFPYAHNELIHYLAEMGLLGFLPLVLLYAGWLFLPYQYTQNGGQTRDLAYMAMVIAVFRIDIGLSEVQFNYHFTSFFYLILFVFAVGFMCREAPAQKNSWARA